MKALLHLLTVSQHLIFTYLTYLKMQRKRSAIGHSSLPFNCPYTIEDAARHMHSISLPPSSCVLDAGCGRAELLCQFVEKYGCDGVGVDINAESLADCRIKDSPKLRLHCADLGNFINDLTPSDVFDCILCVGSLLHCRQQELIAKFAAQLTTGGYLWIGEIVWLAPPTDEFLADVGVNATDYSTVDGLKSWIETAGCTPIVEHIDRFENYEATLFQNVQSWAAATNDTDAEDILNMSRSWNNMMKKHGAYEMWAFATVIATKC